ncbi:DUF4105 domain-containing protein [Helicobacter sp. 11S02629-2]|uniref:lipoprotein N-acyltransferase Lnb domain-containing protein n=1 Tax=Helicobacter sp. 11S02629-2 TaxID=1476195 RepID=UPI000BC811C3|nr:DUF4105 domain-containing protein [Helicobacter sp. 11S02629-2]PAF45769.1 hypothetical protein BKH40_02525 [Helicobacter sp. 11S02629-2]
MKRIALGLISSCLFIYAAGTSPASTDTSNYESLEHTLQEKRLYNADTWKNLLHYDGSNSAINKKSNFFLSKQGYKSPKAEYDVFVKEIFKNLKDFKANDIKDFNSTALCRYPARTYFITKALDDESLDKDVLSYQENCKDLQDFLNIVPIDSVYIEFAAESDILPGSSMGHSFLRLQGKLKKDVKLDGLDLKKDTLRQYALGYFALMGDSFNPADYLKAVLGNMKGTFGLSPFDSAKSDYLDNQQRSVYSYKIDASKEQLEFFKLHLFELRNVWIHYSFITHNCADGLNAVLRVLDSKLWVKKDKPYITPLEHIQGLKDKLSLDEVSLSPNKVKFTEKYGENDILNLRKSTKFALSLENNDTLAFYFAPVYSDIRNVDNSYKDLSESRLVSLEGKFNLRLNKPYLSRIELITLNAIPDIVRTKSISKYVSIRFEDNLYHKVGASYSKTLDTSSKIYPTLEAGLGTGFYLADLVFYTQGIIGYRYDTINNAYLRLNTALVWRFKYARLIASYNVYGDFVSNNRGYDNKANVFFAFNLYKSLDIFGEASYYMSLFKPIASKMRIRYDQDKTLTFRVGFSVNF